MESRLHLSVGGAVQGVGFRPFVYRLATDLGLTGWVRNAPQGLALEVEGPFASIQCFQHRLAAEAPPRASIQQLHSSWLAPLGEQVFTIQPSDTKGVNSTVVLPDIATCGDCLHELFDPNDRRYLYPFINCTNCGPRFSIIQALPYDRPKTTMREFHLCSHCQAEYNDPQNRRFHAQPNACSECGPSLALWNREGTCLSTHHEALVKAVEAIRLGAIVAIKGIGGFHFMVDAQNETAIQRLRQRKNREEKPFALMMPSLAMAKRFCHVGSLEADLLCSPAAPIVLLSRQSSVFLPSAIAPDNPNLGVMLPYSPLHHLLMHELGAPVVATSGNLASEPLCTDEQDALYRLADIADVFLVHNRPIARHLDDSIVQVIQGTTQVLRCARGYAPLPISWQTPSGVAQPETTQDLRSATLAVGAHLKSAVAIATDHNIVISQHVGDLETAEAYTAFDTMLDDLSNLHDMRPTAAVCDSHPDYLSTRRAEALGLPLHRVQHHVAHVLSCMADNELKPPLLGIAWDGSGYGLDGTLWGGEFIQVTEAAYQRVAHFRPFLLPGSEHAIKEPRRSALGLLYTLMGEELFDQLELAPLQAFSKQERVLLKTMLAKTLNTPLTSSVGRLFDAVASLIGLRQITTFEGQAAMAMEFALDGLDIDDQYSFEIDHRHATAIVDWKSLIDGIKTDHQNRVSPGYIAACFHNTLVEIIVAIAQYQSQEQVVLTGGCFQNRYLTKRAITRLRSEGFRPFWHRRVPPNDGGIALGQLASLRMAIKE